MLIAPAQGIGMFEEGDMGVDVFRGVYAGATGKVLEISEEKVWLELDPYTGEAPCPYHVPWMCSQGFPHLVHIFLTSLMVPPGSPEMAPQLEESNRIEACHGRYKGFRGGVVKVSEKTVTVRFDHMLWCEVRVRKTMVALLEDGDEEPPAPVNRVPRHSSFSHLLPIANAISP
jgi:ribosomal protein L24